MQFLLGALTVLIIVNMANMSIFLYLSCAIEEHFSCLTVLQDLGINEAVWGPRELYRDGKSKIILNIVIMSKFEVSVLIILFI